MKLAWDIETTGLSAFATGARILTAAAVDEDGGVYTDMEEIAELLADPNNLVYGHNIIGFDVPWWETHVGPVRAKLWDTRVAQSLVDETGESNSLEHLAKLYCDIELDQTMKKSRKRLVDMPIEDVLQYNVEDAHASYAVGVHLHSMITKRELAPLMNWLMVVGKTLVGMVKRGVLVEVFPALDETAGELTLEIEAAEEDFRRGAQLKEDFNINSGAQMRSLLFSRVEDGGLNVSTENLERTKTTGVVSINTKNLLRLRNRYKGAVRKWFDLLLKIKELTKLRDTYLLPIKTKHLGVDQRVHTCYHLGRGYGVGNKLGGTVTGRLSSSDPNLQNIPRDPRVRGVFIPEPGFYLVDADYAQLELRVAAWYSQEPKMLEAFKLNQDIHTATMAQILGRDYYEVEHELADGNKQLKATRTLIKPINFGMLYGGTAYTILEQLEKMGITTFTQRQITKMIEQWFANYSVLDTWINTVHQTVQLDQRVVTPTGRVRHLPEIASGFAPHRNRALRQGVNFLVQSLASDVMLTALLLLDRRLSSNRFRLLLTVHDSVVCEYGPELLGVDDAIKNIMVEETLKDLADRHNLAPLPLAVDVQTRMTRWGQ